MPLGGNTVYGRETLSEQSQSSTFPYFETLTGFLNQFMSMTSNQVFSDYKPLWFSGTVRSGNANTK